ncbi:uncharacterized protein C8R40DRAFT_1089862 [Lentinula edodes]|uniref:uncharacterized protein n=1 Tax=Lentinula edodes TaxID=5353 RepID=UPI001E8EF48D|nr:uncharacterized protein C8R40DRAFT_1089862 [Lentinula edodes]KAH7878487.1 hypothetical protein C8R40DRAFT_1089862 [Lentinula edodes]
MDVSRCHCQDSEPGQMFAYHLIIHSIHVLEVHIPRPTKPLPPGSRLVILVRLRLD